MKHYPHLCVNETKNTMKDKFEGNAFTNYVSALCSISKNVKTRKVGGQNEVGILWRFANNESLELIYDTIGSFNIYPMGKHLFIYKSIK